MADDDSAPKGQFQPPSPLVLVESIPSTRNGISGIASANAPFVYFEAVPYVGLCGGVGQITLTAARPITLLADGTVALDHVVVGHLRGSIEALESLRVSIDKVLEMARTPARPPTMN